MSLAVSKATAATLTLPDQVIHFHRLPGNPQATRKLLLLHGTGIDGMTTWGLLAHYLKEWSEILVPDLRGVGKTGYPDGADHPFSAAAVVADMQSLVTHCRWDRFDLAGYSYGGTIAMLLKQAWPERVGTLFLLEPALLGGSDHARLVESRAPLETASQQMLRDATVDQGIATFMGAIVPAHDRQPARARWLADRLRERPQGVAYCIRCTNDAIRNVVLADLLPTLGHVVLFTGALTAADTQARADRLAGEYGWRSVHIEGADHGLPMQKPRSIAQAMNASVAPSAPLPR